MDRILSRNQVSLIKLASLKYQESMKWFALKTPSGLQLKFIRLLEEVDGKKERKKIKGPIVKLAWQNANNRRKKIFPFHFYGRRNLSYCFEVLFLCLLTYSIVFKGEKNIN